MPIVDDLGPLVDRLDGHWVELGRFLQNRRVRARLNTGVAAELSAAQLQAVVALSAGPMRIGELADHLGLAESTTTRLVDRLEHLALAGRREDPSDRRSVDVELSPAGQRVAGAVGRTRRELLAEILGALSPKERQELVRLFGKVAAVLVEKEEAVLGAEGRA